MISAPIDCVQKYVLSHGCIFAISSVFLYKFGMICYKTFFFSSQQQQLYIVDVMIKPCIQDFCEHYSFFWSLVDFSHYW